MALPFLVALAFSAKQNPADPEVVLPSGWKVEYWGKTKSGAGGIIGPKGQEIAFSDYFPTGMVAEVTAEMDAKAMITRVDFPLRQVDIAVSTDGLLAISYRRVSPRISPFDFWRKVKTPEDIFETLVVGLSRMKWEEGRLDPSAKKQNVWFARPMPETKFEFASQLPKEVKSSVDGRVLDGTLTVAELQDGRVAAEFAHGSPLVRSVVITKSRSPANVTLAILRALTHSP